MLSVALGAALTTPAAKIPNQIQYLEHARSGHLHCKSQDVLCGACLLNKTGRSAGIPSFRSHGKSKVFNEYVMWDFKGPWPIRSIDGKTMLLT